MALLVATAEIPIALIWAEIVAVSISVAGAGLHYYLRKTSRLKVRHAIKRFFIAAARANRLARIRTAFDLTHSWLSRIYGSSFWRNAAISCLLSLIYFWVAFQFCHGPSVDWNKIRKEKLHLERAAEPELYALAPAIRDKALDRSDCDETTGCRYSNHDPESVRIQGWEKQFEDRYGELIVQSPQHAALSMLTIWEGTYVNKGSTWVGFWLLILNMFLDFAGVLTILKTTAVLKKASSPAKIVMSGLMSATISFLFVFISLYAYGLLETGDIWGANAVLGLLVGLMIVVMGLGGLALKSPSIAFTRGARIVGVIFLIGGFFVVRAAFVHFKVLHIPPMTGAEPVTYYFYLVALATALPSIISAIIVPLLIAATSFARASLTVVLVYLRIVFRMPAPLLITLTGAPAIIVFALIKLWPDLPRLFGHHGP